jgi:uncharacterized cofD-like protein
MFNRAVPKIVTVGGGTGTFVVLSGLKDYPVVLSAIVTMMDSGGSTGKLRDQLGVLPPGDLRQALVALSESEAIWRKLFTYRFEAGDLNGHNFGNIFLSALEKSTGSNQEAVNLCMRILQTKGNVIPVTFDQAVLCAEYSDGSTVEGESKIEDTKNSAVNITNVFLKPQASLNLEAKKVLERADYVIFGPGDLYTSILPNIVVDGMRETLSTISAKTVYVVNLMTRTGQTHDFKVSGFITELEKYIGENVLDYVIVNSARPPEELLKLYREIDGAIPVLDDTGGKKFRAAKIITGDLLSHQKIAQNASDKVKRSLIRHDPEKLASTLYALIDRHFLPW